MEHIFFEVQLCIEMLIFKEKHIFPIVIILCLVTSLLIDFIGGAFHVVLGARQHKAAHSGSATCRTARFHGMHYAAMHGHRIGPPKGIEVRDCIDFY